MHPKRVVLGSDHGGFALKQDLAAFLAEWDANLVIEDVGCTADDARVDYPDYAKRVAEKVSTGTDARTPETVGILVCGTGIGISIAANKLNGIRCALCHDTFTTRMAREHNNANILALGGRVTGSEVARDMVKTFLATEFQGDPRHSARIAKIHVIEHTE